MPLSKINTNSIADDAITTAKITDANITTAKVADDAVTNAKIGAGAIGNTEIDASAAIAQSKLATIASSNLPAGSILQVKHNIQVSSLSYGTTSTGNDFLDTGDFTTLGTNSNFYIMATINHGVPGEENNMDSHDIHFFCMRTASSTHAYVGINTNLTRTTGNAPASGKFYSTDVPFSPSRGLTPAYGNAYDTYHRCMSVVDSPSLSAGVNNRYRIRMFNQSTMYINRGRAHTLSGGTSSLVVMEIQT